jgi:hypothetical protein
MMAGHDNYNNTPGDDRNLGRYLWLGAIETLINAFIDLDGATRERVHSLHGLVVRVKIIDPYLPFYLLFTSEGIEVCEEAPYPAQVRVNAKLFDLMRTLLGTSSVTGSGRPRVRVWGESASVAELEALLVDFNLRTRAQQWLQSNLNFESLWQKIRNHDPSWLQDFLPLPGLMRETLSELRLVNQNLKIQQLEFELYRKQAKQQRIYDLAFMALAFLALLGGLGGNATTQGLSELSGMQITLIVMGLMLIFSRLRS